MYVFTVSLSLELTNIGTIRELYICMCVCVCMRYHISLYTDKESKHTLTHTFTCTQV